MKKQNKILFENEGEIDIQAITTFGISAKVGDNPIGYFGTGLKYAIAILIRCGCKIEIHSGETRLEFSSKNLELREKAFDVVTMSGADLPFTTELGKNWDLWQAFREIYCNCLDESGTVKMIKAPILPTKGKTRVIVIGEEFEKLFHERDSIVLNMNKAPIFENSDGQVFNKPSHNLYYRGVNVMRLSRPSLLTYNITGHLELTEDRTIKYSYLAEAAVARIAFKIKNKNILTKILNCSSDFFENTLSISDDRCPSLLSDEFIEVMERDFELNKDTLNRSTRRWYQKFKDLNSLKNYKVATLSKVEESQINKCLKICRDLYPNFDDYDFKVVENLGENTMALADQDANCIVISKRCFTLGTKYLFSTIIEEYFHLSTGYEDCTRNLQTYLFDTIATLIENHVIQEPI